MLETHARLDQAGADRALRIGDGDTREDTVGAAREEAQAGFRLLDPLRLGQDAAGAGDDGVGGDEIGAGEVGPASRA